MILVFALLLLLLGIPIINLLSVSSSSSTGKAVAIIGHRGAGGLAPENTLPAIDSGLSHHASYIEVDVRVTRDGELVIMHDKGIDRTTDGKGDIHELTFEEISRYTVMSSSARVPLLREVLLKIKDSGARLLIEIKDPSLYPSLVDKLVALIEETGAVNNVAVFSFDKDIVKQVKERLPAIETGVFCLGFDCNGDGVDVVSPHWISLLYSPSLVRRIHAKGAKVFVWTVDRAVWMRYVYKRNVDGIITNRPDILNALLHDELAEATKK